MWKKKRKANENIENECRKKKKKREKRYHSFPLRKKFFPFVLCENLFRV